MERKYEIRYLNGTNGYYCILWTNQGQNIFILKPFAGLSETGKKSYEAVRRYEEKKEFPTLEDLYKWVHNLR